MSAELENKIYSIEVIEINSCKPSLDLVTQSQSISGGSLLQNFSLFMSAANNP